MERVAKNLETTALNAASVVDVDSFGRSAFNRYYYATFLYVRSVLRLKDIAWGSVAHANVPDILEGAVLNEIRRLIKGQTKNSLISLGKGSGLLTTAAEAAADLAELLRSAYRIRCDADYEPELLATRELGTILLRGNKLSVAAGWQRRAEFRLGQLMKIWKDLGIPV